MEHSGSGATDADETGREKCLSYRSRYLSKQVEVKFMLHNDANLLS